MTLTKEGREELALALILWKDFKCGGQLNLEISTKCVEFAKNLGVLDELNYLTPRVPPMLIVERYPRK